jgi:hypothetical protein
MIESRPRGLPGFADALAVQPPLEARLAGL